MKGLSIKCPNCAARLDVKADQDDTTCTYCGTAVVVRRRSKILERPLPPPRSSGPGVQVATVRRSNAGTLLLSIVVLGAMLLPIGIGVKACLKKTGLVGSDWSWDGVDSVILTDINGDGTLDAIGRVRNLGDGDVMAMAAFDGRDGDRLWRSGELGSRGDVLHTVSGLAPGLVIAGGGVGELVAFGSADGSNRWRIRLAEKVKRLCTGPRDGTIIAETADDRAQVIALADGRVEGEASGERGCAALQSDADREEAPDRWLAGNHDNSIHLALNDLEGMYTREAIIHPQTGTMIAVGNKQPGTSIPMIARITPGPAESEQVVGHRTVKVLWTALVPANDPLSVPPSSVDPEDAAVDGEGVAVTYNVKFAHYYRVTLFSAADGRRLWDAEVPGEMPMSAVRMSPTHVFVSTWDGLFAYDRKTGKRSYTIE